MWPLGLGGAHLQGDRMICTQPDLVILRKFRATGLFEIPPL